MQSIDILMMTHFIFLNHLIQDVMNNVDSGVSQLPVKFIKSSECCFEIRVDMTALYYICKKAELNESGFFLLDMTKKEDWFTPEI
ncbi:hypothetical protein BCT35_21765 [Vibrio lentus]|nr:hypothetical protein BCT35_21765 [Vibrio lentus]